MVPQFNGRTPDLYSALSPDQRAVQVRILVGLPIMAVQLNQQSAHLISEMLQVQLLLRLPILPAWRNGRRNGLKIRSLQRRASSSLAAGTKLSAQCNGSTTASKSVCQGSSPCAGAIFQLQVISKLDIINHKVKCLCSSTGQSNRFLPERLWVRLLPEAPVSSSLH